MRHAAIAVALACTLGACKREPDHGFAVEVTIETDGRVDAAAIASLDIVVSGDDRWMGRKQVQQELAKGSAGWVYYPKPGAQGSAHFTFDARDGDDTLIASGATDARLIPGRTTSATVTLTRTAPDLGEAPDLGVPADLAPICRMASPQSVRSELFVSVSHSGPSTGESDCPYATIGDAIAAANLSLARHKTIHLGRGTYGKGESFPLELRGGISLVGDGSDETTIVGSSRAVDRWDRGGVFANNNYYITVLVGDAEGPQLLRGIALRPGSDPRQKSTNFVGVLCDRGNAYASQVPVDAGTREPNLVVHDLDVSGFTTGIAIGTSEKPTLSGCNAKVTHSTFSQNGVSVWMAGYVGDSSRLRATAQIGDGTEAGANQFVTGHIATGAPQWFGLPWSTAILAYGATTPFRVLHNTFKDYDVGILLQSGGGKNPPPIDEADVEDNSFDDLAAFGIRLRGNYSLRSLARNRFSHITGAPNYDRLACTSTNLSCALWLTGAEDVPGTQISSARGNTFVGNDIGIYFADAPFMTSVPRVLDFGNAAEDGKNTFHCNGTPKGVVSPGYDVWFDIASASDATLGFVGNHWDHATPTTGSSGAANGTDLVTRMGPTVDTSRAKLLDEDCPADRTR